VLILTRKLGESITIGDDVRVSVLGIRGRQVRIGIEAPSNVVVHREEIYVKVQEENRKASGTLKGDILGVVKMLRGKMKSDSSKDKSRVVDYKDRPRRKGNDRPGNREH